MRLFADNAESSLASSIDNEDTTIALSPGEGGVFPSISGSDYFDVTITQAGIETEWEIVKVTARADDSLTVVRGQHGTTAVAWAAGSKVELRLHAGIMEDVATMGKSMIGYFPAGALKPQTTNGPAALAWDESSGNKVMTGYLAFDAAAVEYAQFSFKAPKGLDESAGFTLIPEWKEAADATTHDVVWQVEMQAQGDGDTIDSAWGTGVTVTDTGASGTRRFAPETGTITPAGTWAAGDEIIGRISRLATDEADTLDVDAHLIGFALYATYTESTES